MSGFSAPVQVILRALKTYGMILADNGSSWFLSGAPDDRWDNDVLHEIRRLRGSDFEAVDESGLMLQAGSAQARGAATTPAVNAIVNAGSFAPGAISPGEIVSLFGSNLGSDPSAVKVTFNGVAAPLLYAGPDQINAVAPYSIAGKASTAIQVSNGSIAAPSIVIPVVPAAPGIFVVLNQNYTINSASNPAAQRSILILYATGEGQTIPAGVDGKIANAVLPRPVLPVSITVGGQIAKLRYAGAAPTFIAGAMQINVELPAGVTGSKPLVLDIGGHTTQINVQIR